MESFHKIMTTLQKTQLYPALQYSSVNKWSGRPKKSYWPFWSCTRNDTSLTTTHQSTSDKACKYHCSRKKNSWGLEPIPYNQLLQRKRWLLVMENYCRLKLLNHIMRSIECVIENISSSLNINEMQYGFMPGHVPMDAIFILWQMHKKHFW